MGTETAINSFRFYIERYRSWPHYGLLVKEFPHCEALRFNAFLADLTLRPPLWLGNRQPERWMQSRNETLCFNKVGRARVKSCRVSIQLVHSYYNDEVPLLISKIRWALP